MADLRLHVFAVELPLARGIDGEAHRGTLEEGGRTVAVLGCGIEPTTRAATPSSLRIREQGAVVSEYQRGSGRLPGAFRRGTERV